VSIVAKLQNTSPFNLFDRVLGRSLGAGEVVDISDDLAGEYDGNSVFRVLDKAVSDLPKVEADLATAERVADQVATALPPGPVKPSGPSKPATPAVAPVKAVSK
jgi:hypothetical protein